MKDHPVYFILYSIIPSYSSNKYLILAFVFFSLTILYTQCVPMYTGMQVFYAESLTTFVVDLNRCEPTLFLSVPRLWTKFQGGVLSKLPASKLDFILKIPLINILIKNKVRTPNYCLYYFITGRVFMQCIEPNSNVSRILIILMGFSQRMHCINPG